MLICRRRSTARMQSASKSIALAGLMAFALLSASLACARSPQPEAVTLTFLDIEWDMSVRPMAAEDLQAFTQTTGIRVKAIPRPDGSLNQLALFRHVVHTGAAPGGPEGEGDDLAAEVAEAQWPAVEVLALDFWGHFTHDEVAQLE